MIELGDLAVSVVRGGHFRLDGGAMFGIVPKPVWSKLAPADDRNRVELAVNVLLIRSRAGLFLVDTGLGAKHDEKWTDLYGIRQPPTVRSGLAELGLTVDDITGVILTHLHFDHAGGATQRDASGAFVPAFPRAKVYVQRGAAAEAADPNPRTRGSYRSEDVAPLQSAGVLVELDGSMEVAPGIRVLATQGHCGHHQAVIVEGGGRTLAFWGDLVPTTAHLRPAWTMGYDLRPAEAAMLKQELLARAARDGWISAFDHDPKVTLARLRDDGRGGYIAEAIGTGAR